MSEPFLGQLALYPYNFIPKGWAQCAGQILTIASNSALFSLLGDRFGGDGRTTFGLPDLRGRAPQGMGLGPGLSPYAIGDEGGAAGVTLSTTQTPAHTHAFPAFAAASTTNVPSAAQMAQPATAGGRGTTPFNAYATPGTQVPLSPSQLTKLQGGNQAHNNMQPSLVLTWCIATVGIYPQRP